MSNSSPRVGLVDKARLDESPRVLRDSLNIPFQVICDVFNGNTRIIGNGKQYVDAPMIGDSF